MLRFPVVRCSLVVVVLIAGFFHCYSVAQSTDDVHIAPRAVAVVPPLPSSGVLEVHQKPVRVDVNLVVVPVMVTDSQGSPVMDLRRDDFQLFEGEQQQHLSYFYSEDAPISVGLIVDLSGSMGNKLDRVREAVNEFFKIADPQDDYFVITFSDKPKLLANTTQSTETIQSKLAEMKAHGNTALADAIYAGLTKLKSAQYRRKALVVISDGGDNASRRSLRSVKNLAKESDAEIYAVDVCDAPNVLFTKKLEEKFGKQWLTQVTNVTGGRTIVVDNAQKIPAAAAQVSRELRNQYVLAFRPKDGPRDGKWRKLRVKVVRPTEALAYQVYYRTGYLARKDEAHGE
jgi:Ca-activated chloride channel homolog